MVPDDVKTDLSLKINKYVDGGNYFIDVLYFCLVDVNSGDFPAFYICDEGQRAVWQTLANGEYKMEINLGSSFSKLYTFDIVGAVDSEGTSVFPIDP